MADNQTTTWFEDEALLMAVVRGDAALTTPVIAGYRDLRELKRGGQGVVFVAVQQSTNRPVAIKLLLAGGLATAGARRRFEREAELAASLRHPNIVRIFDSGVTGDGSPFLVMEYVEGGPLLASSQKPDVAMLRARMTTMMKVVGAVSHAHQHGVLHRDLKPGNVRIDNTGEPRVLDFGLARSLGAASLAVSTSGQFVGSLPWASPEQLDDGVNTDTRSDIYALGVMLHQLATGSLPYDTTGPLSAAIDSVRHRVPESVARINPAADANLSTIISMCLAKERDRRYPSAQELASDLEAWLEGEPIRAQRDSAWYTLRRNAARYRTIAAVVGVAAVCLGAASAVAIRAASIAGRERDAAHEARGRAETVTGVLTGMIVSPDPTIDGRDVRVVDVLDEASRDAGTAFRGDASSELGVRIALGHSYSSLGQAEASLREAERALAIIEASSQPRPEDRVDALTIRHTAMLEMGREKDAVAGANENYAFAKGLWGDTQERTLEARSVLAGCLEGAGEHPASVEHKRAILEHRRERGEPEGLIIALNNLAVSLSSAGDLSAASTLLAEAHAALVESEGPRHPNTVVTALNLATLLKQQGLAAEAMPLFEEAIAGATEVWGPEHLQTLSARGNRATALTDLDRPAEAAAELELLLAIYRRVAPEHPRILNTLSNLASAHRAMGDLDVAATLFEEAVDRATVVLGPTHRSTLMFRGNRAELLTTMGRAAESAPLLERLAEDARQELGLDNWVTGTMLHNLGSARTKIGDRAGAIAAFTEAYEIFTRSVGPSHHRAVSAAEELAALFEADGDGKSAEAWRGRAVAP